MCGRYATTRSATDLAQAFQAEDDTEGELAPDYNLAPTDPAPIVRVSTSKAARVVSIAKWGFIPSWADDPRVGARMINARSESVATAKAFASAFKQRRCLVPADGWFEWRKTEQGKLPYFMTVPEGFAFAGLWSASRFGLSCTILTTAATGRLLEVHARMPLALEPERWQEWLTEPADGDLADLLHPASADFLGAIEIRPVSPAVGNIRNDGPELLVRVEVGGETQTLF